MDPRYGSLALAVLVSRFVQGQLDLFWVAVQGSIPFVVLGICLGVEHLARQEGVQVESAIALEASASRGPTP
jgi:hypothetical protein